MSATSLLPARVVVLGIDAASPALVSRWMDDGTLPNLSALRARGRYGDTRGIDGFFVGSTWPSLYTATNPARHGVHYGLQLRPGSYEFQDPASGDFVHGEPFWSRMSRAGRRIAILDVPLSRLDSSMNGIHVVEWGGHDAIFGFSAWPPSVETTIATEFGAHPAGPSCDAARRSPQDYERFVDALVRGVHTRTALTHRFLAGGDWDFFMQVFTESHCAGHQCWHLHDRTHPAHDTQTVARTGDPLLAVYGAIDAAIGDIIAAAGKATIIVFAAHGMAHWYGAGFLLRDILFRLNVARPVATPATRPGIARKLWRSIPAATRERLAPLRDLILGARPAIAQAHSIGVDPAASRCFAVPNGLAVGGIRLNVAGREPHGTLHAEEIDAFCRSLSESLLEIVDERTGRPLVQRVLRTASSYRGDRLDALPDLLVEWSDDVATGSTSVGSGTGARVRAHSPVIGSVEGMNDYGRTGEHRRDGFVIAAGPGITAAPLGSTPSIVDLAPTFCALVGVPFPDVDGRPIPELIAPMTTA
jgi:predicted AlkP superfamily phosphohydrolase/phosphomutase